MRPPRMMCSVCRHPLNATGYVNRGPNGLWLRDDPTDVRYIHGYDADHEPVPVPRDDEAGLVFNCDFCNELNPEWSFPCQDFVAPGPIIQNSGGHWTACTTCKTSIEANDYEKLLERSLEGFRIRHMNDVPSELYEPLIEKVVKMMHDFHQLFRQNRTGPPYRNSMVNWEPAILEVTLSRDAS